MPITAVDVIGPHKGADRAVFLDAAIELLAGEVDFVDRQHRRHLQLVRAVLHEIVQPVVIGPANRRGELRIHIVPRRERQTGGREQHRDVDSLHLHAHDLGFGVVAALDREHHIGVGAARHERAARTVVLRDVAVIAGRRAVEEPQRPPAHPGWAAVAAPHRGGDAVLEGRIEVFVAQVRRLHDVHVAIDKPVSLFHPTLLQRNRGLSIGVARPGEQASLPRLSCVPALPSDRGKKPVRKIDVLAIQRLGAAERAKIEAVDPSIRVSDAGGWCDGEYRETWPAYTASRYLRPGSVGAGTREERDRLLAEAEVILGGWAVPLDLRARATRLKWFHQRPAGASNLRMGDLWGSSVVVTTSRGLGNTLAMAEYAVAGILHLRRGISGRVAPSPRASQFPPQ